MSCLSARGLSGRGGGCGVPLGNCTAAVPGRKGGHGLPNAPQEHRGPCTVRGVRPGTRQESRRSPNDQAVGMLWGGGPVGGNRRTPSCKVSHHTTRVSPCWLSSPGPIGKRDGAV